MNKKFLWLLLFVTPLVTAEKLGWNTEVPLQLLMQYLPQDAVILEAGAHYGQDTEWMAQTWPTGQVHAFEPTPVNFEKVKAVAQKFDNISIYQLALDVANGVKPFFQDGDEDRGNQGANSLLLHNLIGKSSNPPFQVECVTIDSWAAKHSVEHIDFMWLDIEGNELNALRGATAILPTVRAIFTEVNLKEFWHGCVLYDTLRNWLQSQGFQVVWQDIRHKWNGNVLFVRSDLLD